MGDEHAAIVQVPPAAELAGLLDVRRGVQQIAAGLPVLYPAAGFLKAEIVSPEGAEHFDEESAAARSSVANGDADELGHKCVRRGEVRPPGTYRFAGTGD